MSDTQLDLVRRMYVAASRPDVWPDVLERYRVSVHSSLVSVLLWDRATKDNSATICVGPHAAETARGYNDRYGKLNPHMRRKCSVMVPGNITFTHRRVPVRELVSTEYFADYAGPLDMHAGMGLPLLDTDRGLVHVSALRPFSIGCYGRQEAMFVRPLIPHLRQAFRFTLHLRKAQATGLANADALDALEAAVLVLDTNGRVLLANASARRLAATGLIRIGVGGIQTPSRAETLRLRDLIRAASQRDRRALPHPGGVMAIALGSRAPLIATVTPTNPALAYPVMPEARVTVVLESRMGRASQATYLQGRFGLTAAAARVAARLVAGDTLVEAADALGTTRETARTHLKSILQRSGAKRQSDFVRLALRGRAEGHEDG